VVLTVELNREAAVWVAVCRELGTAAEARTVDAALHRLDEFVTMHLESLEETGQRDRFFQRNGVQVLTGRKLGQTSTVHDVQPGLLVTTLIKKLPGRLRVSGRLAATA